MSTTHDFFGFVRSTVPTCALFTIAFANAGCATTHSIMETEETAGTPAAIAIDSDELDQIWANWWPEQPMVISTEAIGPSLVAGDWLAWQCAFAGDYFEMTPETFASMIDSQ
jgi:hypothetical protein